MQILSMYEEGRIWLKPDHFNSQGNNPYDGAASLSNIRDTCYGRMAKRYRWHNAKESISLLIMSSNTRSHYGVAPGGCVCLHSSMLETMRDYAEQFYSSHGSPIEVNAIAGSEHSSNSWHYQGNTMDVSCTTPVYHCEELEDFCRLVPSYSG